MLLLQCVFAGTGAKEKHQLNPVGRETSIKSSGRELSQERVGRGRGYADKWGGDGGKGGGDGGKWGGGRGTGEEGAGNGGKRGRG